MIEVNINIEREAVYNEVAKTTAYTGAKMGGDGEALERIPTTDGNQEMFARWWREACSGATEVFKPFLDGDVTADDTGDYTARLSLSPAYDPALTPGMQNSLFSYFVLYITGKWFTMANKAEAEGALADAAGMLGDVERKIYYRRRPRRPDLNALRNNG